MEEITRFAFKPRELLRAAYLRLRQLILDTELQNPHDAAEDYMAALLDKYKAQIMGAVHLLYGKKFDLNQVYETVERIVSAYAYTRAYNKRPYYPACMNMGIIAGTSSNARYGWGGNLAEQPGVQKDRIANAAGIIQANCMVFIAVVSKR